MFLEGEISIMQIEPSRLLFNLNTVMLSLLVYKHIYFKIITIRLMNFEKHKHIVFPIVSVIELCESK